MGRPLKKDALGVDAIGSFTGAATGVRVEFYDASAESLPSSLSEAIAAMEKSQLVREVLGEPVFEYVLRNKRAEWQEYRRQVTAFELDRYLPVL